MYTELDPRRDMQPHLPRILNREVYYKGQTVIEQDSDGFHAYYIEKGRVEVLVHDGPHEIRIAQLGPGEIFGEMALIEHESRSATVRALEDTTITVISSSELERKIHRIEDKAVSTLMHVFMNRLRRANTGQLCQYRHLAEFQDHIMGLVEKTARGVDEKQREAFRGEAQPLLAQLEDLLEKYSRR